MSRQYGVKVLLLDEAPWVRLPGPTAMEKIGSIGRRRITRQAAPEPQYTETCTWSSWLAVGDPRSSMDRHPSPARSTDQIFRAWMM